MIGYKDKTFCTKSTCKHWNECHRALTEKVQDNANNWWGSSNAPIITFKETPKCYERKDYGQKELKEVERKF